MANNERDGVFDRRNDSPTFNFDIERASGKRSSYHESAHELSVLVPATLPTLDELKLMTDKELHEFRDSRGFTILMIAAEAGELETVQSLIDRGEKVDAEVGDESAVSLAYKGGHHEIVLLLLKNNAKFPQSFNSDTATDELKEFLDLSNEMHDRIRNANEENFEELKVYLKLKAESFQSMRYFYDPIDNYSILKRAILAKKFEVYEFLLSLNIFLAHHESMDEINRSLSDEERDELSDINLRISPDLITEPMMILMRNCKLGPDTPKGRDADFMSAIRHAFDELFMIPAIAIVLRIVAASRDFKIIFDFRRDWVNFLDPNAEPYCDGLAYLNGKIYVGAKDLLNTETVSRVTGVIAHELTHYAMFLVYGNWAKPFKDKDKDTEAQFERISQECDRNSSHEKLIDLVYECYETNQQHAELIVRVPHMMAVYSNSPVTLDEKRRTFQSLFNFYEQVCMPEMEAKLPKIEKKFCPINNVEKKVKMQKRWNFLLVLLILVGLFLSALGIWFLLPVSWSDLNENERQIVKNLKVEFYGVEVKFGELFANDSKVFDSLSSEQLKKTLKGETEELSRAFNETLHHQVFLTWSNMTKELKENFLQREVDFQGQKVKIGKITKSSDCLKTLNMEKVRNIFSGNILKVSYATHIENKIYIERFFTKESERKNLPVQINYENIKTFKDFSRIFLLSSAPGDGKSTTFRHFGLKLKKDFPNKWIQFVDLKKNIEAFKAYKKNDSENMSQFLSQKVLNLIDFDLALFKHLYDSGNLIFLWDGVDEIAPKLTNTTLDIVKKIAKSKNFQFVSTRPRLSGNLQNEFSVTAYKLVPFNEQDRFEFLIKVIASEKFNENGDEVYEKLKGFTEDFKKFKEANFERYIEPVSKAMNILKFSEEGRKYLFVSNPLMISMISEISIDENFKWKNFNSYFLFESFIKRKLKIIHEKGPIVQEDTDNVISKSLNIWQVHQFFALKLLMKAIDLPQSAVSISETYLEDMIEKSLKIFSGEQISRFGILHVISEDEYDFAHRTFAEFFTAQFFRDNVVDESLAIDIKIEANQWKILSFSKLWVGSKIKSFIYDALELEKLSKEVISEFFPRLIRFGFSKNLNNFQAVYNFIFELALQHAAVSFKTLYDEIKSKTYFVNFELATLFYTIEDYKQMSSYAILKPKYKEIFENLRNDLREESRKGVTRWGGQIRNGQSYEQIYSWTTHFSQYRLVFELAIPDIIRSAYAKSLNNFENVLKFIRNFPSIINSSIGLSALYNEMNSNLHLENFQLMIFSYVCRELTVLPDYQNIDQKYKDVFQNLLYNLESKRKAGIVECMALIKSKNFEKIYSWNEKFGSSFELALPVLIKSFDSSTAENLLKFIRGLGGSFEVALPDHIKSAYSNDSSEFLNVLEFIRDFYGIELAAVDLSILFEEMKSKNDLESFKLMMIDYLVKEYMQMENYPNIRQDYKNKFETLKVELSEKSKKRKEGVEEFGAKIRNGKDFREIIEWAKILDSYGSSFELVFSALIKSAYSNDPSEFLNVLKFIRDLPAYSQAAVGLSSLYDEMKSKNDLESFKHITIDFSVKEYMQMPNYPQYYKIKFETLKLELSEKSKEGVEEFGAKIKNGKDYQEIIEWAEKFYSYGGSFELALPDLIKSAYSNDSSEFLNILTFIRDLPFIDQSAVGYSALYEEMKSKNDSESFKLMMIDYLVKEYMKMKNYPKLRQDYKNKFETLKLELSEKSKEGVEEFGAKIKNGKDYQEIIEWAEKLSGSFRLALPDFIKSAYSSHLSNFEDVFKFIQNLPWVHDQIIGLSVLYDEMKSSNHLEYEKLVKIAKEVKRIMELNNYSNVKENYKTILETLRDDLPNV